MQTILSRSLKKPLTWVIALTLVYLAILAVRPAETFFGVPGQWAWSGRAPAASTIPRWWPSLALLALFAAAGIWYDKGWETLLLPVTHHRAAQWILASGDFYRHDRRLLAPLPG